MIKGMNRLKKTISILSLIVLLFTIFPQSTVFASENSFSHIDKQDGSRETVLSREMYYADKYITANSIGLENALEGLTDVCYGNNGEIYILCGENSRIIELNPDYFL